ncbi:hypothetical protein POG09_13455, partial [Coprococcus comes]|uniref:hypothetical protein n=1 Tax=Coprococcus comes TaxID=410072 RepID=UPI001A9B939D
RKKDLRVYNKPLVLLFFGTMLFSQPLFFAKIFSATRKLYEDILRSEREYPRQTAGGKQYVGKGV